MLRLCKSTIAENGGKWERRGRDETQRIRDAERKERLTIIEEKKRRFGKKYMKKEESDKLKLVTNNKLEMAEMKKNFWRKYRDGDQLIHTRKTKNTEIYQKVCRKEKALQAEESTRDLGRNDMLWQIKSRNPQLTVCHS